MTIVKRRKNNMIYKINGIEIETSNRGRSGYLGVTISPAWTLDLENPFIACLVNPVNDPVLSRWLTATERNSLHLGTFADSREAAYVVGLYKNDPENVLKELYHNKKIEANFPPSLYDIPEYFTKEQAQTLIKDTLAQKTTQGSSKPIKMHITSAMEVARNYTKGKKIANISVVRKGIESNLKEFKTAEDVEKYVATIAKF